MHRRPSRHWPGRPSWWVGAPPSLYDLSTSISQQFNIIEIIVVIGIFIVLMIVLGSLLLPLFAVLSIAMSIVWSFAVTYLVFGTWLGMPILFIVPLILFVMLMGIGMDYNVFILTRIREEVHKGKAFNHAIVDAVDWTGGIITALALIMAGAFGSMMLSSNNMLVSVRVRADRGHPDRCDGGEDLHRPGGHVAHGQVGLVGAGQVAARGSPGEDREVESPETY